MPFQTARTTVREYRPETDAEKLLTLWNDPEIQNLAFAEHLGPKTKKFVDTITDTIAQRAGFFGIVEDKESGAFVGQVALSVVYPKTRVADVAISLAREYWGKGYGTELMLWTVQLGFHEWGLHRIQLTVGEDNKRAAALYKNIGFVQEGVRRDFIWSGGRFWGLALMSILENEWDSEKGEKRRMMVESKEVPRHSTNKHLPGRGASILPPSFICTQMSGQKVFVMWRKFTTIGSQVDLAQVDTLEKLADFATKRFRSRLANGKRRVQLKSGSKVKRETGGREIKVFTEASWKEYITSGRLSLSVSVYAMPVENISSAASGGSSYRPTSLPHAASDSEDDVLQNHSHYNSSQAQIDSNRYAGYGKRSYGNSLGTYDLPGPQGSFSLVSSHAMQHQSANELGQADYVDLNEAYNTGGHQDRVLSRSPRAIQHPRIDGFNEYGSNSHLDAYSFAPLHATQHEQTENRGQRDFRDPLRPYDSGGRRAGQLLADTRKQADSDHRGHASSHLESPTSRTKRAYQDSEPASEGPIRKRARKENVLAEADLDSVALATAQSKPSVNQHTAHASPTPVPAYLLSSSSVFLPDFSSAIAASPVLNTASPSQSQTETLHNLSDLTTQTGASHNTLLSSTNLDTMPLIRSTDEWADSWDKMPLTESTSAWDNMPISTSAGEWADMPPTKSTNWDGMQRISPPDWDEMRRIL